MNALKLSVDSKRPFPYNPARWDSRMLPHLAGLPTGAVRV